MISAAPVGAPVVRVAVPVHVVVAAREAEHAVAERDEVALVRELAALAAVSVDAAECAAVVEGVVAEVAADVVAAASVVAEM